MQFTSWKKANILMIFVLIVSGCATAPGKPSLPARPWLNSNTSRLPSQSTEAFGVKFIVRATTVNAIKAGVNELKRLKVLYDSQNGTELSQINQKAFQAPVTVTPETARLLDLCQKLYEFSNHKFDITFVPPNPDDDPSLNAVTDWSSIGKLPTTQHLYGSQNVLLDSRSHQVRIYNRRTKLNLNGMIRGYAIERMTQMMIKARATGGEIVSDGMISVFGNELKNTRLICVENPYHLGICQYRITPKDLTKPLYIGISASKERKGAMFDPKDTWTYRSGGITVAGDDGAWVQFAATMTSLMDDGQLEAFLKKDGGPKLSAIYFDQNQKTDLKGSLAPFANVTR
jgi:thiamine biosynthesis lipoprotein ApbE